MQRGDCQGAGKASCDHSEEARVRWGNQGPAKAGPEKEPVLPHLTGEGSRLASSPMFPRDEVLARASMERKESG